MAARSAAGHGLAAAHELEDRAAPAARLGGPGRGAGSRLEVNQRHFHLSKTEAGGFYVRMTQLLIDSRHKCVPRSQRGGDTARRTAGSPDEAEPLRRRHRRTGFIGEVHARAVRRAGARLVGVAASSPYTSGGGPPPPGRRGRVRRRRGHGDQPRRRRRPHLHPQPPARRPRRGGPCRRQARRLREAAGQRLAAARSLPAAAAGGRVATVPFVYRFYPLVREARARVAAGGLGPVWLHHGATCRTGWPPRRTTTGGSTPSSPAPPGRSPTSARTGATSSSSSPATASPRCAPRP